MNLNSRSIKVDMLRFFVSGIIGLIFFSHFNLTKISFRRPKMCAATNSNVDYDDTMHKRQINIVDESLYIGMMSTKENLETRVKSSLNSWLRHKPDNVVVEIFSSNDGPLAPTTGARITMLEGGIRVIELPGVPDKTYPPQKKSFAMIKYMHDNYKNRFKWFMRLDDDAYVKLDGLVRFLSRVNASTPRFIGQPGFGRNAEDYIGGGENYCMGGPGVIFSQAMLHKVGPKLKECLRKMYTDHEDVELGRCVVKSSATLCTTAWDSNEHFVQNYPPKWSKEVVAPNIEYIETHKRVNALTLHSNKVASKQMKLHKDILSDTLQQLLYKSVLLKRDIELINGHLQASLKKNEKDNTKTWNYIHAKQNLHYYMENVAMVPRKLIINQTIEQLKEVYYRTKRNEQYLIFNHFKGMSKMFYKFNPLTGYDVITTVVQEYPRKKSRVLIKKKNFHLRVPFANEHVFLIEDSTISRELLNLEYTKRLNVIVAVNGRSSTLKSFLTNLEHEFLWHGENINLILTVFRLGDINNEVKSEDVARDILKKYKGKYQNFECELVLSDAPFTRGYGLKTGINHVHDPDELMFFCDVDMVMTRNLLTTIRRNTIKGKQVYCPTVFGEYDQDTNTFETYPRDGTFELSEIHGFWRTFSYGMLSIYKQDFDTSRGFDLTLEGWGMEDVKLLSALQDADLQIFRGNEPSLVHVYHDKTCDAKLSWTQRKACRNSRAIQIAPSMILSKRWDELNGFNKITMNLL